jgi:hypothetical protein
VQTARDFVAGTAVSANSGESAAARSRAPPPNRVRAWPAAGSAADDLDQPGPQVNSANNGQPGVLLLKRPPTSFILHAGPSTLKDSYKAVLNFMFKPLSLLDLCTRGLKQPFYD